MQVKKQQLEPHLEQQTGSKSRKEYVKVLSPCLFNLYAEHIMQNAGLDGAQAGIKIARRNVDNLSYQCYGINWRGTEEPLDESERREGKSLLKTQH